MPYRILCNGVKREFVKASPDLASGLFYSVPLHKIRYGIPVGLSSDHQGVELTLNDTSQIKAASLLKWEVQLTYTGDSVTKSWIMPYMG